MHRLLLIHLVQLQTHLDPMPKPAIRSVLNRLAAQLRLSERSRRAALYLVVAHRQVSLVLLQHRLSVLQQPQHLVPSVNKNLLLRSEDSVPLNLNNRIRSGLRLLDSHNQPLGANHLVLQRKASVPSRLLPLEVLQPHYLEPPLLHLVHRLLQLSGHRRRQPLVHRLLLHSEHRRRPLHLARLLLRLGVARCLDRVPLRSVRVRARRQLSGALRRHHHLGLHQGVHLAAVLGHRLSEVRNSSSNNGLEAE